MKVPVVKTEFPVVRITVIQPDGVRQVAYITSGTATSHHFTLPSKMHPKDCFVYSEFCDGCCNPVAQPVVHWGEIPKPVPEPEPESVPEPAPEPEPA